MAPSVLYFGPDECNRVLVLKGAGYSVRECVQVEDLQSTLRILPSPAAVLMNGGGSPKPAIEMIHTAVLAPVIVFSDSDNELEESVDLIVPPLTPPAEWLRELAEMIERNHALKKGSGSLREISATTVRESAAVRTRSATGRAGSALLRERGKDLKHEK